MAEHLNPQPSDNEFASQTENGFTSPNIGSHLDFLRTSDYRFARMTAEQVSEIQDLFVEGFTLLPHEQQIGKTKSLEGVANDIEYQTHLPPAIANTRQADINKRIIRLVEDTGVVYSVAPDGLTQVKDLMDEYDNSVSQTVDNFSNYAKRRTHNTRRSEVKETAKWLINVMEGIDSELKRLGMNKTRTSDKDVKIDLKTYNPDNDLSSLYRFGSMLETYTSREELIGFSILQDLISEFGLGRKYSRISSNEV